MIRIARMVGFLLSAVGVQIASGVGAVALVLCALMGWRRTPLYWLVVPIVAGAGAAHVLFEDVATGGKVVNALSNLPFELIVYLIICVLGYAVGALARRFR